MGKKEKARAVATSHEFAFLTDYRPEEIFGVLEAAGDAAATGGLKGRINCIGKNISNDQLVSEWEYRGPGGVVQVMTFTITAQPVEDKMAVRMKIAEFMYQKQTFMKPTLNGGKRIREFERIATSELNGQEM